mmetsp:Transcript_3062/g.7677  ORF Transcript_3062/g.7677 Transcript_3062/m.7677 type:complete len:264 (+) Transcript_3062:632-1423(+)
MRRSSPLREVGGGGRARERARGAGRERGEEHGAHALVVDDGQDDARGAQQQQHAHPQPLERGARPQQAAHAVQRDHEEVHDQHRGARVEARQQRHGAGRVHAAKRQVVEARLPHLLVRLVARVAKHLVQRVGQRVDGGRHGLAPRVKVGGGAARGARVLQAGQRAQHVAQQVAVRQRDRHAAARQRVAHVERVAQHQRALRVQRVRVQLRVLHHADLAVLDRVQEVGAQHVRHLGRHHRAQVALHLPGQLLTRHIHQAPDLCG